MDKPSANALAIIGPRQPKAAGENARPDRPLPLDDQTMDTAESITIDLTAYETWIEQPASGETEQPAQAAPRSGWHWEKYSPIAASVALATVLGILAGTAATVTLMPAKATAPSVAALPDDTRDLQERVAKLSNEVASLKSGFDTATRTTAAQLGNLAKIMESLERLERRTASAAAPAQDVTGSVTSIEKKPPTLEGWRLHDFYAGRAVLESRTGTLYEVGPGSTLPGIGRIETIRRVDGKIVVTTPKGTITSALEQPRRPAYHLPRGY